MKIYVEFTAEVPAEATEEEVLEWVRFCLGTGSMSAKNPLSYDLVADFSTLNVDLL
jgi:hypothetical protein